MKRIALLFTLIALTGCKTQISAELFTSDLIAATEGETITAPLVIGMEASSEDKCNETAPAVLQAIKTRYSKAEFIGCEDAGWDTFARFRVQAEVIAFADEPPAPNEAFAIGVRASDLSFSIVYLVNRKAARAIWDALPEELTEYQTYKLEPVLFALLNNDLRTSVTVTMDDVFADGTPSQGTVSRDMPRRDQIELRMSDVTNAAFATTAHASHIVTFTLPE